MKLKIIIVVTCCFAVAHYCFGQQQTRLKNVAKVLLIYRGAVAYGGGRTVAILPEHNKWNAYQILLLGDHNIKRDTNRKFIKEVQPRDLAKLLKILNKEDTCLSIKKFHIDKELLVRYIDSITINNKIPAKERAIFERYLRSGDSLQKVLSRCIKLAGHSDYSYKFIRIITKANDTIKVDGGEGNKPYYLPWRITGKPNYDPSIDGLFNVLSQKNATNWYVDKSLYADLCKCAYMECFHKKRDLKFFYFDMLPMVIGDFKEVR